MMGDWSIPSNAQKFEMSALVDVEAPSAANTKSSWVEIITATEFDANAFTIVIPYMQYSGNYLMDFGIGAAASEQIIVENLEVGSGSTANREGKSVQMRIPIPIPAGTRIAARVQVYADVFNGTITCGVLLETGGTTCSGGKLITLGADDTTSFGLSIDPGGVANTKGSWVEVISATENDIVGGILCFGNQDNTGRTDAVWAVDIGIGASGSEQVYVPDYRVVASSIDDFVRPPNTPWMHLNIPTGTRISARAACTNIDANDRLFDLIMHVLI